MAKDCKHKWGKQKRLCETKLKKNGAINSYKIEIVEYWMTENDVDNFCLILRVTFMVL